MAETAAPAASAPAPAPPAAPSSRRETVTMLANVLWFPLLFVAGFLVFYFVPFHTTTPHHMPVAVVGQQAADRLQIRLDGSAPGAFDLVAVPDAAAGREQVLDRDADGALALGPGGATLYVAGANGRSLTPVLQQTFTPVAQAAGVALDVVDLAPLRPGDTTGASFFYLALIFNLIPYVLVMFIIQQPRLGQRRSLLLLGVFGAVASVVVWLLVWPTGVLPVDAAVVPVSFLMTQAVGWTAYGLVPLTRRWFPGVLLLLFVLMSIPSSSGAVPVHLVPRFFQLLHPVMPLGSYVSAARGILYFGGHGVVRPVLVLVAWLAVGIALVRLSTVLARRAAGWSAAAEQRAADEVGASAPPDAATVRGAEGVVVAGSVVDDGGHRVTRGTVTATTAAGEPMGRVPIRGDGTFAQLVLAEDGQRIVVTAFGEASGVGAVAVRVRDGRAERAEVRLTGALGTRVADRNIDSASGAAAAALGGA